MSETALQRISIVLVEPAGPANVGSAARILKNMGLARLVLVSPQCDCQGDEARKMAVRAGDVLDSARTVESLDAALEGCQRVAATTARDRSTPTDFELPETIAPWLLEAPSALVFGREDRGLSNEQLNRAQRCVRIPSSPVYPSLNLAQAVAVCAYALYVAARQPQPVAIAREEAPALAREAYYRDLEDLLLNIGYLYPHTAASRMAKLRRLLDRAAPSPEEIAMLRGILRQANWALARENSSPKSVESDPDASPEG